MKEILIAIVVIIVIISSIHGCIQDENKRVYKSAYEQGYNTGYKDEALLKEYQAASKKQANYYNAELKKLGTAYGEKIQQASKDGYDKGMKDTQEKTENQLKKTAAEKEKKGKWNDVLFDVN